MIYWVRIKMISKDIVFYDVIRAKVSTWNNSGYLNILVETRHGNIKLTTHKDSAFISTKKKTVLGVHFLYYIIK